MVYERLSRIDLSDVAQVFTRICHNVVFFENTNLPRSIKR